MGALKFLEHVLAEGQHYCIFAVKAGQKQLTQKFFSSLADMGEYAQELDETDHDVYFALASFLS